jgi:hypothetical protein
MVADFFKELVEAYIKEGQSQYVVLSYERCC